MDWEQRSERRKLAMLLLSRGLLHPSEVSQVFGISRQLVSQWLAKSGFDWRDRRKREVLRLARNPYGNTARPWRRGKRGAEDPNQAATGLPKVPTPGDG